jgi:DNA repair protein RadC
MSNGTLLPVRSDDKDISDFLKSLCQDDNAFRMDAIIIGNQDYQSLIHDSLENDAFVARGL